MDLLDIATRLERIRATVSHYSDTYALIMRLQSDLVQAANQPAPTPPAEPESPITVEPPRIVALKTMISRDQGGRLNLWTTEGRDAPGVVMVIGPSSFEDAGKPVVAMLANYGQWVVPYA